MDDKPLKYGGRQSIFPKFDNFHISLKYTGALMYMGIRKPTRKEINEIEVVDLTSASIWNPREEETDTAQYLVWEYRDETKVIYAK